MTGNDIRITRAIKFNNTGGVFQARDNTSNRLIIVKEARPSVLDTTGTQLAADLLRNADEILRELAELDLAPKPLGLFEESGHWFLVEERLAHEHHLGSFTITFNPLAEARNDLCSSIQPA